MPGFVEHTLRWRRPLRRITVVLLVMTALPAAAVTVSVIGPDAITVAPGEVFTIDVALENETGEAVTGVGVWIAGFTSADATVLSGRSARDFFVESCIPAGCAGGASSLDNAFYDPEDLPSGAFYTTPGNQNELGQPSGGESIPVIYALSLIPGASGTGENDPGLDGALDEPSPRDATIDLVAFAIGVHTLTLDGVYIVYPSEGVKRIENTATFTVTVREPGSPVPEPSAALVFGVGLVVVASAIRRREAA